MLLLVGILTMPGELQADGQYSTSTVGTPAYAALFTANGAFAGYGWLVAGVTATVYGGIATLGLVARSARGPEAAREVSRRTWGLAALALAIGLVLLLVGLVQVPRGFFDVFDVDELGLDFPGSDTDAGRDALERANDPVDIPGRGSLDLGTGLVAIGATLLACSGVARGRGAAGRGERAAVGG